MSFGINLYFLPPPKKSLSEHSQSLPAISFIIEQRLQSAQYGSSYCPSFVQLHLHRDHFWLGLFPVKLW